MMCMCDSSEIDGVDREGKRRKALVVLCDSKRIRANEERSTKQLNVLVRMAPSRRRFSTVM